MVNEDTVGNLMSRTVHIVSTRETVDDALAMMVKHDIGSVVVEEEGKAVGILTERDIVKLLRRDGAVVLDDLVKVVATRPLVTVEPDTPVWEAFTLMLKKKIRRLPVVENDKLLGIVTERDLFKWVVKVTYEPNIPEDIKNLVSQNP
jgi:CBS domain-containing protein